MLLFVRRRITTSLGPLLAVLIGVFVLARLTGDPSALYLAPSATADQRERFAEINGFNDPIWEQLWHYVWGALRLDLGTSLRTGESAATMALRAFPATVQLAGVTMLLAVVLAVSLGSAAALRPNGVADRAASLFAMAAASIPDFWLAIVGILIFAITFEWLPTSGVQAGLLSWVLPVLVLLMRPLGVLTQVVRGSMIAALTEPYAQTARSKGAGERRVVVYHALRNASAPALTVAGDLTVGLINGAVVVESIFGWPGIGKLMIDSILDRDFAVLQAAVLVTAIAIFVLNIMIDVLYAVLDPRVRPVSTV